MGIGNKKSTFSCPKNNVMNKQPIHEIDQGYFYRALSIWIAVILTAGIGVFIGIQWYNQTLQLKKGISLIGLVFLLWLLAMVIKSLFDKDRKKQEVEDLFKTIREARRKV